MFTSSGHFLYMVTFSFFCVKIVEEYLQSTHAPTHCDYTMSVLDIFSVDRDGETGNFNSQLHNRSAGIQLQMFTVKSD